MKINESINDDNYSQKVVSVMKPPYIEDLRMFKIPTDKWLDVFSLLFNKDKNSLEINRNINSEATIISINIPTNPPKLPLYVEWDSDPWILRDYDEMGNMIYYEESDGYWEKYEYNDKSAITYYENSDGYSDDYIENNLNESVGDKENMVIDKISQYMLEDTTYKIKTIKDEPVVRIVYPFYGDEIYTEEWSDVDYYLNYLGDYPLDDIHLNYINNQYGITDESLILEIFNKYTLILFTQLKKEIESKMEDNNLNESVDKYYNISKVLNPPYFRDLVTLGIPQKEWDDIFKHIFKDKDIYVLYIGITDSDLDTGVIVDRDSKTFIYRENGHGNYQLDKTYGEENNLNESVETNNRFLDKVVESLIGDTRIVPNLQMIVYPSINFYSSHMSLLLPSKVFYNEFSDYCEKHYGTTSDEFDIIWKKYSKIMFDKFDDRENILKESDDRRKNYLVKVLEFILSDTHITSYTSWEWVNIEVPFTDLQYSRMRHFVREDFFDYCRDNYGLTINESYSVWVDYINEINQILINEWGVQDPIYN